MTKDDLPIISFQLPAQWEQWLAENQTQAKGIWMRIFKKNSGTHSVTYQAALETALCFGWIDGQKAKYDEASWLQKFTPRRPKSIWSKINTQHVERLMKAEKMKLSGLKEVEAAKLDGRWQQAYDSHRNMNIPEDFLERVKDNPEAADFFGTLNKTNLYAIAFRLQTAKRTETREKRMREILEMLSRNEKFH